MIIGTVVKTLKNISDVPKDTVGLVVDEFDRGEEPGGRMGAQMIFQNGAIISVARDNFAKLFSVAGFCRQLGDYEFISTEKLIEDYSDGRFDRALKKHDYVSLQAAALAASGALASTVS